MDISSTVALVTGGASGLGLATAQRLLAAGGRVCIVDLPSSDGASVAEEIGASFAPADVTDEDAVATAVEVAAELGELRIAVNCAGIGPPKRVLSRDGSPSDLGHFRTVVEINLIGTFNVVRLAAAEMARHDPVGEERGVIVNAASKGGVVGMTLPLARDLAQWQIRTMTIAPGLFRTPLLLGLPEEALQSLSNQVPHPSRLGDPDEYGLLVQQIIENPMLNGEVIRLDGAIRMGPR